MRSLLPAAPEFATSRARSEIRPARRPRTSTETLPECNGSRRPELRSCSPPAVHTQRLTGHEAGTIRGQKGNRRRHLIGRAKAAHRNGLGPFGKTAFEIVAIFPPVCADRPCGANWT